MFFFKALHNKRTTLTLSLQMTPWSIGWRIEVVFGGKKKKKWILFLIKFMDLISEDLTIHPTLLCDILAEQMFNIFKTARVFLFGHKKHGKLFSCSTYCHHFGYSYFALLPSKALFPFELMGFIRETLVEEAKIISIRYIFQLFIWESSFIPRTGHFICNRLALITDNF